MGGRRCIIINAAAQIPETAPATYQGRQRVEKLVRAQFQNPAIAGELDDPAYYEQIVDILKTDNWSTVQLQFLLDKLHSIPPTD